MENIKKYVVQYQAIVGFVLGVLATLATLTPSEIDDQVIKSLNELNKAILEEATAGNVSETVIVE